MIDSNALLVQDIEYLREASIGYRTLRHRFIDTYKRDQLGLQSREIQESIRVGNRVAHGADALTDASLYTNRERSDADVFCGLYGLSFDKVVELNKPGCKYITKLLNYLATRRANGTTNADIEEKFANFVSAVEQNPNPQPQADPLSPIGRAYYSFWKAVGDTGK